MPGLKVAEQHNPSVDERLVDLGLCGQTHLPSGRVCVLTARHSGGCVFLARELAETLVTRRGLTAPPATLVPDNLKD